MKKTKKKKMFFPIEDPKLNDIKRIYLADYPEILERYDAIPFVLEKSKHHTHNKRSEPNFDSPVRQSGVHQTEQQNYHTIDVSPAATHDAN